MNSTPLLIKNVNIYAEEEIVSNGSLFIESGIIRRIFNGGKKDADFPENTHVIDGKQLNLVPGFIDGHIHGAAGADVMDATKEAIDTMASILPKEGTTSFLATTMTQSVENIEKSLENLASYESEIGHSELLGIHLEGPFVNKNKAGAQPVKYIIEPNVELFKKWQSLSNEKIKTITLAPEFDKNGKFIAYLNETGVNVSAGHTDVGYEGLKKAIDQGVHQVTHLCNAMTGIHHRDIGAVGATFYLDNIQAELIADCIHVSPEMLQLIYNNLGSKRIMLITDAMRAKALKPGNYELGGQPVKVTGNKATLENGSLAGSVLKMHEGVQNMLSLENVTFRDVIQMASVNPAKQIEMFHKKGSISENKDADLLLVDDKFNIKYTICRGVVAYKEGN